MISFQHCDNFSLELWIFFSFFLCATFRVSLRFHVQPYHFTIKNTCFSCAPNHTLSLSLSLYPTHSSMVRQHFEQEEVFFDFTNSHAIIIIIGALYKLSWCTSGRKTLISSSICAFNWYLTQFIGFYHLLNRSIYHPQSENSQISFKTLYHHLLHARAFASKRNRVKKFIKFNYIKLLNFYVLRHIAWFHYVT